jgi:hypothetical protein
VTLRFWDGSELCAPADRPSAGVLHVRREAVGYFLRQPNQLGLARAYVAGALDLDGDPAVLLAERHRFEPGRRTRVMRRLAAAYAAVIAGPSVIVSARRRPPRRARAAACTRRRVTAVPSATTTTSPTRSTDACSGRPWFIPAPISPPLTKASSAHSSASSS